MRSIYNLSLSVGDLKGAEQSIQAGQDPAARRIILRDAHAF